MQNFDNFALHMHAPQRPSLTSHQSSSLPSTPYQHARKLSDECRIPSPIQGTDNSPSRSAHSESDSTLRAPGRSTFLAGCKYETGMAFSRRRIPYSEGGDKLERATSMPKKYLDPKEEGKLSGDMRELYDRILPSRESEERRALFVHKLDCLLNNKWPGNKIKVHVFGSSGNMLCTSDSDVDICITTPMRALERVCLLAKALAEHGMERVVCVPHAKVPIVKIWDPELQLACDLNVNNTLALENTRMIKTYVEIDDRVRPLAMIIKHWTRMRILNDAALGGTLSSYTWICMIINFLQTRNPKILPSLHKRPHQRRIDSDGTLSAFADDIESLRGFGKDNQETIGELLFHFFRRYAHEIDFDKYVISVREGQLISKQAKKWHLMQNNRLCVEEPFNTDRNLGNTVDDTSFRGVHKELRKAFDLVSEGKLSECCEQYVFPPAAHTVWAKPPPQPRPVLSRSASQSGRAGRGGGSNGRGGRQQHQGQNRGGPSNRRASSAAALNKPIASPAGSQNSTNNGFQIHDQLYNQYQILQAQEAQLRLHLHNRAQAQLHAQTTAQLQPLKTPGSPYPQFLNSDGLRRQISNDSVPMSAPMRQMAFFYPMPYISKPQKVKNVSSQPGVHTNPSSPSMTPVQPVHPELRRSLHRSQADNNSIAALRSHSQPASAMRFHPQPPRQMPSNGGNPMFQGSALGISNIQQYQQSVQHQMSRPELHHLNTQLEGNLRYSSTLTDLPLEDAMPKEYVGYYVHDSPPPRPYRHTLIAPIPSYNDLVQRARGMSPDLTRVRHTSRSPSPSSAMSQRDRSISFHSAGSYLSSTPTGSGASVNWPSSRRSGPIIANGSSDASMSDYATPPETQAFPTETSEGASLSDEPMDTPVTASVTPSQEIQDSFVLDPLAESSRANSASTMLQFGDFPARSTFRPSIIPRSDNLVPTDVPTPKASSIVQAGVDDTRNGLGTSYNDTLSSHGPLSTEHQTTNGGSTLSNTLSNFGTSVNQPEQGLIKPLKPLPHLSPVREVRTPSPTALRREEMKPNAQNKSTHGRSISMSGPSPLSSISNGKQQQLESFSGLTNGIMTNGRPKSPQGQSSGWQQSSKKGRKNKGKGAAKSTSGVPAANGELGNAGERKGG